MDGPPFVLSQPVGQPAYLGAQALLQVTADGSGPLYLPVAPQRHEYRRGNRFQLPAEPLLVSGAGYYSVVVSNAFGAVSSAKASRPVVQMVAWGAGTNYGSSPNSGQSLVPAGLNNAVALAGGGYHSLT